MPNLSQIGEPACPALVLKLLSIALKNKGKSQLVISKSGRLSTAAKQISGLSHVTTCRTVRKIQEKGRICLKNSLLQNSWIVTFIGTLLRSRLQW